MSKDTLTATAIILGFALTCVGVAISLGVGWSLLWGGLLVMAAALFFDARS